MNKEKRDTLMTATYGLKEISHLCIEMGFDFKRLIEFVEDERSLKIIKELVEKTREISNHCVSVAAICETVADGKSGLESVQKTIDKMMLNGEIKEIKMINEEDKT